MVTLAAAVFNVYLTESCIATAVHTSHLITSVVINTRVYVVCNISNLEEVTSDCGHLK